ncbi:PA domain-containing protein [Kribbella pratensis]|uniref:PA domain-containing protein n=1 Tax=Kribbella pratensis TaxID=2512112 RepID=A0ABY2F9K1_9ACTN|nr:S8 family serine peptidase [Kribbella pratensis]TDW87163.1 PA domain-containing protein [Kribbella pratensis]
MSLSSFCRRGLTALGAAVLALAAVSVPQAGAATPAASTPPRTVTLITGDKVTVTTVEGRPTATVSKPNGTPAGAHIMTVGNDLYVYPDAALPYLASGVLDERLFNVTELLSDGYDDAHSDGTPLIVSYAQGRKQAAPAGARQTRALTSIKGAALTADHDEAAAFWTSFTGGNTAARTGIAKIWLDGKAKATLSDTTTQIGAPEVWQGGNTGQGVDVAVLDTGIDAAHPDFGGRIVASQSFVPGQDVTDRNGHGTHVASTIAGTGAASGGKEQGVAPGAGLHIGKVLNDDGSGQDSWILAGMEWAARDQRAEVISMSLGSGPTDGTDPMSQAVNTLSAETGALFVIAAGNSGPDPYSVSAPGAADAALTVGAVDSADRLASFSSRGPRLGDSAVKPDLTAPGVGVLAARSQYSPEGEGPYVAMNGTSMATPHVAGAAALLANAHPDWTGQQLKDALVSTTKTTQQYSPFAAGTGRLDVATAVRSTLYASGSAFAAVKWPYPASGLVQKDVTYTNNGAEPVTLNLSLKNQGIPAGLFTLTTPHLTVPAHGTATAGVVSHLDLAVDDAGYSSMITATDGNGAVLAHTSIGVSKQSQRVKLSLRAKDPHGAALSGVVVLKDIKRDVVPEVYVVDGSLDVDVRPSTYAGWMYADVPGLDGPHSLGRAVISQPEVDVTQDQTLTFDAAGLRKVAAVTPRPSDNTYLRVDQYRSYGDLHRFVDVYQLEWWIYDSLWATPTRKVTQGSYTFATRWRQVQPALTVGSFDSVVQSWSPKLPEGVGTYPVVYVGSDPATYDVRGKIVVAQRNDAVPPTAQAAAAAKGGAKLLLILNDGYGPLDAWADLPQEEAPALPVASLNTDQGKRLLAVSPKLLPLVSHPYPDYIYDLVQHHDSAVPKDPGYRPGTRDLARIDESFRDTKPGDALDIRFDLSADLTWAIGAATTPVPAQDDHTVWVTASPKVKWLSMAAVPDLTQQGSSLSYRAGSTTKETWFAGIQRPRLLGDSALSTPPSRVGDIMSVFGVPGFADSGPHQGIVYDVGAPVTSAFYQGDTLIGEGPDILSVEVAPEPLPYRLVVDTKRDLPNRPYSPSTHTEWGFTSGQADYANLETLPLLQLDYSIATDLSGRAKRHADLAVAASHLPGAVDTGKVSTATLELSYDDGATWRSIGLQRSGAGWRGKLDAPASADYVSMRVTARDDAGNSVSQTIQRAFGVR